LTGSAVGIPREDINAIKASLKPGTSAIVAVVDQRWVADLERSLHEAQATEVLARKIAGGTTTPDTGTAPKPEGSTQENNP
jgi:hypothetical protein